MGADDVRVVIADDDRLARHFLAAVLQDLDVPAEVVASVPGAQEAIDAAAAHQPDLALVDFTMPGGGPMAARGIRRVSPATSVIAVSAHDDLQTVREMLQAGASTYLVKGMPVEELVDVLARAARARASGTRQAAVAADHPDPGERRISVLLVEPDAVTLDALAEVITRTASLNLIGLAQTAFHAASLAARHRPDVALVSDAVPGSGGARVAAEIASVSPTTAVLALRSVPEGDRAPAARAEDGDAADALAWIIHRAHEAGTEREAVEPTLLERLRRRAGASGTLPRRRFERLRTVLGAERLPIALQPIVRLEDARPTGYEALARFPAGGTGPDVWFADARRLGVATELELLAVRSALEELPRLPEDAFLAVNVSPATVLAGGLLGAVAGADPGRVVIELTEHAAVEDYDELRDALSGLRERGVRVAVDDCGAGFASLRHVALVAPDFLKLDVVLCRDIREPARAALARALVTFAAETGSHVIAEGIEARDDLLALRELGVTMGQGYLLARPAFPDELLSAR